MGSLFLFILSLNVVNVGLFLLCSIQTGSSVCNVTGYSCCLEMVYANRGRVVLKCLATSKGVFCYAQYCSALWSVFVCLSKRA